MSSCLGSWRLYSKGCKTTGDRNLYPDIDFKEKILQELAKTSNNLFRNLDKKGCITQKELKYFSIEFKKATNFTWYRRFLNACLMFRDGRLYRTVIAPRRRFMQQSRSYIKDSSDLIKELKEIKKVT